jgi:hypothetical protein
MSTPAADPAPPASTLDQYKAYLQDLGNIGVRATTANGFYLSILTALLGLLTLMQPTGGLSDLRPILRVLVPVFALLVCWAWWKTMRFYSALYKVKFDVLRKLEEHGGLYPVFEEERQLLQPHPWLSRYEQWVPILLGMPFFAVLVCALWHHRG